MSKNVNSVLINATNLHVGGGVQVAVSFIDELSRITSEILDFHVICSSKVDEGLIGTGTDTSIFSSYQVYDVHGLGASARKFSRLLKGYDAIFTVFGPDYRFGSQSNTLVGFARGRIIYLDNESFAALSPLEKIKVNVKHAVQVYFYKKARKLVVELPHVKQGLLKKSIAQDEQIEVVYNSVSNLYFRPEQWQSINLSSSGTGFKLGFVGRDYPHKNLAILPEVKAILDQNYGLNVHFYVTLSEAEWASKTKAFKASVNTVGELSLAQCPTFYKKMDAVIFPSLLECFSATPLEAMAMERPLFASDRGFVRDVCKDFAYYFDPLSPESIAFVVAEYINTERANDHHRLAEAKDYARSFSSPRGRAESYVRILENMVSK